MPSVQIHKTKIDDEHWEESEIIVYDGKNYQCKYCDFNFDIKIYNVCFTRDNPAEKQANQKMLSHIKHNHVLDIIELS